MTTLKKHIEEERLHQINRAWKYMTVWQRGWIFVRAIWWSLPSIYEVLKYRRRRVLARMIYCFYKVHWVK